MNRDRVRRLMCWAMAAFYVVAGVLHLTATDGFLLIVPDWVPAPREVVLATGLVEIAGAAGLITRRWRSWAGLLLALYAVAVFPANINHALAGIAVPGLPSSWWYHAPRLALQPVLVWWALFAADVIDWPFARRVVARRNL
jgi:uncharacterized membrane protein